MDCHHCGHFVQIIERLDLIMAAQDDINNAVAAIQTAVSTLGADVTAIQAALAAGGGTPVDTTALNTAVASLPAAVAAVTALAPAPPPPAPAPVAAPAATGEEIF